MNPKLTEQFKFGSPTTGYFKTYEEATKASEDYLAKNPATIVPTVITSKAAADNLEDIKLQHKDIVTGMTNQAATVSTAKATRDAAATVEAERQAKLKESKDQAALKEKDLKIKQAALEAKDEVDISKALEETPEDRDLREKEEALEAKNVEYEKESKRVLDTILGIQEGTIPLSATEQAMIRGLEAQFKQLIEAQKLQNITDIGLGNIRGFQKGAAEYDPSFQVRTIGSIITGGLNAVADLEAKMAKAVGDLTFAIQNNKIDAIQSAWDIYNTAAEKRITTLNKAIDDARAAIKKEQDKIIQATRDTAIADLMNQGITDPKTILDLLNFDEGGNLIGNFTAEEVSKTLKSLAPEDDLDKLSGATRNFYILKGRGELPGNIASLPENQQLFAYLRAEKAASTIGGAENKITLSEAKSLSLPISTVGMSEKDILEDLQSEEPPAWFIEKLQNELQQSILPEAAVPPWNEFRREVMAEAEGEDEEKLSNNYKKARQYFEATYEGLTDEDLDALAGQVETYVNGGMSYAEAVEQTIKDIE